MKCPLTLIGSQTEHHNITRAPLECIKEECEWWDKELECCDVTLAAVSIATVAGVLEEIRDQMPQQVQP